MARISVAFLDPACLRDSLMTSASRVQDTFHAGFAPVRLLALLVTTLLLGHSGFQALAALPPAPAPGAAAHSCPPEFSYDGFDRRVSESYDAAGRPTTQASAGVSPTDAYDTTGNRRFTCDNRAPRSHLAAMRLQTACDARHRTITIAGNYRSAQTLGHFTNSHYDPGGTVPKPAEPDGAMSDADYDGRGRPGYAVAPGNGGRHVDEVAGSEFFDDALRFPEVRTRFRDNALPHIFRPDHNLADTPANRNLLRVVADTADDFRGVDQFGNQISTRIMPDGSQIWTQVRNGQIFDAGRNLTPWNFVPGQGLIRP